MKSELESLILEILSQKKVRNQTGLVKLLLERGVQADQSTLSRHLSKLGIEKKDGFYSVNLLKKSENVTVIPVAPNLVVIRTLPGHAQAIAFKLDNQPITGIVGTIAGDDTILCIVESPKTLKSVCNKLQMLDFS